MMFQHIKQMTDIDWILVPRKPELLVPGRQTAPGLRCPCIRVVSRFTRSEKPLREASQHTKGKSMVISITWLGQGVRAF